MRVWVGAIALCVGACSAQQEASSDAPEQVDELAPPEEFGSAEAPLMSINDRLAIGDIDVCADALVVGEILNGFKRLGIEQSMVAPKDRAAQIIEEQGYNLVAISAYDYKPEISELRCEAMFETNNPDARRRSKVRYSLRPEAGTDNFVWSAIGDPFEQVIVMEFLRENRLKNTPPSEDPEA